jgi:hypothetical protein
MRFIQHNHLVTFDDSNTSKSMVEISVDQYLSSWDQQFLMIERMITSYIHK